MGIISTEVEVQLCSANIKHYEELGYEIPRVQSKHKSKLVVKRGTKILVKVEDLPKKNAVLLDVECDYCGKKYKITNNNYEKVNHDKRIYCRGCAKKLFNSNINHPLYKPEISIEEREQGRFYPEYIDFIKRVLRRDNYICQCCGKHRDELSCSLSVHHLDGYNWCKEKRTDDTNGITLCENCHTNFHSKYGKGDNTKEQFEEWIGHALQELEKFQGEILFARKIYCFEEDKIYNGANEYCRLNNLKSNTPVYNVCNHKKGYKTVNGKHLFWYDEYTDMSTEEINNIISSIPIRHNRKSVICLNTGKIYTSINDASKETEVNKESIRNCCHHRQNNVCSKSGDQLQFMFLDEYLQPQNCETN